MLKEYSLPPLQFALNRALSLDPNHIEKLKPFLEKCIKINIVPLNFSFFMRFIDNEIALKASDSCEPDAILHASPIGLIRLSLLPASSARSLFNDRLRIEGDTELGMQLKQLFDSLDLDWEGHLARFTGDMVAQQFGRFIRKSVEKTKAIHQSFKRQTQEYIYHEAAVTPSQAELANFYDDVDELMLDTERLEAKITLFIEQHNENN